VTEAAADTAILLKALAFVTLYRAVGNALLTTEIVSTVLDILTQNPHIAREPLCYGRQK
jgi:hypothetical protein